MRRILLLEIVALVLIIATTAPIAIPAVSIAVIGATVLALSSYFIMENVAADSNKRNWTHGFPAFKLNLPLTSPLFCESMKLALKGLSSVITYL